MSVPFPSRRRRFATMRSTASSHQWAVATTLSGGPVTILERHSCVFAGRRFAHIVLRYKEQSVSLLVAADERPGGAFLRTVARTVARADDRPSAWPVTDGLHVASFRVVRHAVFVVSSLGDADLEEVTRAMAGSVSRALAGG